MYTKVRITTLIYLNAHSLCDVVNKRDLELTQELLRNVPKINQTVPNSNRMFASMTPIILALKNSIEYGLVSHDLKIITILLAAKADLNACARYSESHTGCTPLSLTIKALYYEKNIAAKRSRNKIFNMIELLITNGAMVNEVYEDIDDNGIHYPTPLMSAVKIDLFKIVKLLMQKGADPQ